MKNIDLKGKCVLITGAAGFIGSNLVMKLLRNIDDIKIIGIDNINDDFDVSIKEYCLRKIQKEIDSWSGTFKFIKLR